MKFVPRNERGTSYLELSIALAALLMALLFRNNFAIALICGVVFAVIILRRIDFKKHVILKRALIACSVLLLVSFVIVESFVLSDFGTDDRAVTDADYVVILGSGLKGTRLSLTLKQRLDASLLYVNQHPEIPIIVSGGQGPGEDITEAAAMKKYLVSQGVAGDRIKLEDKSTSTKENLSFSKKLMQRSESSRPKIIIVTSDYHLFRAKYIAATLGYEAYGISGDSPLYLKPINMIREYLAVIKALL
ncbi:YdcF family protein [Paenibacillus sp. YPG26]|uniref:YdcF family protein n=1 Tax=Paenibacillus sp. YPG26 TaxID=2878915 RepID=UPI00203F2C2B|nr:YdcF family protein [Paenibacillus sp. YPG26]USB33411.1 YdcF family protein [Paenibacillus sp. YPG26]